MVLKKLKCERKIINKFLIYSRSFSGFNALVAAARDESTVFVTGKLFSPPGRIPLQKTGSTSVGEVSAGPVVETRPSTLVVWYKNCLKVVAIEIAISRPANLGTLGVIPHTSRHGRQHEHDDQKNGWQRLHPKTFRKNYFTICKKLLIPKSIYIF